MNSGCNSVVVTGLTVSRGAGSVTVVTTSATVAAEVIAANLNQCHEVFSSAHRTLLAKTNTLIIIRTMTPS